MNISINGKPLDAVLENEATVGEVLGKIESECEKAGMTITGVMVDGTAVAAERLDALFAEKPDNVGNLELTTLGSSDIREMLLSLGTAFLAHSTLLLDVPIQLQTGKDLAVMQTINGFSADLQNLYRLLPLCSLCDIDIEAPLADGSTLSSIPGNLAPLLSDLLEGLKNNDTVLVGDISEYELSPRIVQLGKTLQAL